MSRFRNVAQAILAAEILAVTACSPTSSPSPTPASSVTPAATDIAVATPSPVATASVTPRPATSSPAPASPAAPFDPAGVKVDVKVAAGGLASPVDVTNAGDGSGRLFVVEQAGRIRIVRDGALVGQPFLDIKARVGSGGERGLLGLAFHPKFPADPRFFVDYTDSNGDTNISSFRVSPTDPDAADPASETILLHIVQPFPNHNGGSVDFGPDGMLYIGMGDGGSGGDPLGNGQRLDTLLAKVLRIDVDKADPGKTYAIPPDNPFVSVAGDRPEIWQYGLRNPWRMRFDFTTGDLWIGDVGQNAWEEIDVVRAGSRGLDFGWNVMESFHCYSPASGCNQTGLTLPVAEYGHGDGCAVIGGVVVRGASQGRLDGGYLFGDACSDNLWLMDPAGDGKHDPVVVTKLGRTLSSINEAEDGSVYATSLDHGELLQISATGA